MSTGLVQPRRPTPACRTSRNASNNCVTGTQARPCSTPDAHSGSLRKNPFYLSYTGLLAAVAEKRYGDGEALCQEALGMRHNHAQLYLNLAEVYQQSGRTQEAIATLEKGLVSAGRDFRIRRALQKIGARRDPIVTFLHRSHPVNRTLGRLRHRLSGPSQAA